VLTARKRIARTDAGFTLIELLLVIVLLGVITLPLANAVISVVTNVNSTSDRLTLSHDAQMSTAFFAQDVATVGMRDYTGQVGAGSVPFQPSIQLNAAYNAGGQTCGTSATPVAVLRLLSDDWGSGASTVPQTDVVAYYLVVAGTIDELHRMKCVGSPTPTSDVVIAHDVQPASPAVTCSSTCTSSTLPQWVKLSFTVIAPSTNSNPPIDTYPITLNGQRRQT
jgi:prepilin-type N-terminal cleavage/methylation domain-containing protein